MPLLDQTSSTKKDLEDVRLLENHAADMRVNQERIKEVLNVQASPKLLTFWKESMSIVKVACGSQHTVFLLGKF